MSHYLLLVITDEKQTEQSMEKILLPFHEYECTGITEYTEWVDKTDEVIKEWDGGNGTMYSGERFGDIYSSFYEFAKDWMGLEKNESGQYGRRTNPNAKWDWWKFGGRWDGLIPENSCQLKDLSEIPLTFAVLKDGKWYERGKMLWFGITKDENPDWEEQLKLIYSNLNQDQWLTFIDCHI